VQQAVWPTEDFELVKSLVSVDLPEHDLFTGIREPVRVGP
jgi:mycothiol S-conjugate amidase